MNHNERSRIWSFPKENDIYFTVSCMLQMKRVIAKDAEQYYPNSIQPQVIRIAEMFYAYLIAQKATRGRKPIPQCDCQTSFM